MNLWGPHQYPESSVSLRGLQYGKTLSRRRCSVGFFQSWHGPSSLTFFLNFEFGAPPKNSEPNPISFQFLTQGTWAPQKVGTPP